MSNFKKIRAGLVAVNKAAGPWVAAINPAMKNFAASSVAKSITAAVAPLRDYVQGINIEKDNSPGGDL